MDSVGKMIRRAVPAPDSSTVRNVGSSVDTSSTLTRYSSDAAASRTTGPSVILTSGRVPSGTGMQPTTAGHTRVNRRTDMKDPPPRCCSTACFPAHVEENKVARVTPPPSGTGLGRWQRGTSAVRRSLSLALWCAACADVANPRPENAPAAVFLDDTAVPRLLDGGGANAEATNVLLLLIDDVGVDRFAVYGAKHAAVTPVIDDLAREGVLFENAWGYSLCAPTRAALQTGRHARRTGFGDNPDMGHTDAEL